MPYANSASTIIASLKERGAAHVEVEIWNSDRTKSAVATLEKKFGPNVNYRAATNAKMLILRHAVYEKALKHANETGTGKKYKHFLYLREDNVFTEPSGPKDLVALDREMATKCAANKTCAVLDLHCGWGSLSDKVYWVTRQTGDLLFGSDGAHFDSLIRFWTTMPPQPVNIKHPEPLTMQNFKARQTETMYTAWMKKQHVATHTADFQRTGKHTASFWNT